MIPPRIQMEYLDVIQVLGRNGWRDECASGGREEGWKLMKGGIEREEGRGAAKKEKHDRQI